VVFFVRYLSRMDSYLSNIVAQVKKTEAEEEGKRVALEDRLFEKMLQLIDLKAKKQILNFNFNLGDDFSFGMAERLKKRINRRFGKPVMSTPDLWFPGWPMFYVDLRKLNPKETKTKKKNEPEPAPLLGEENGFSGVKVDDTLVTASES